MDKPRGDALAEREQDEPSFSVSIAIFLFRLVACLGVSAGTAALYAAWEATPPGPMRLWMLGLSMIAVPVLYLTGEGVSNPVLEALERRTWWCRASSALRIGLGVIVVLPFVAFLVGSLWFFRRVFGVEQ